jgi:HK97 family phage portal protein
MSIFQAITAFFGLDSPSIRDEASANAIVEAYRASEQSELRRWPDSTPLGMPIGASIQSYITNWSKTGRNITPENARESPTVYACVRLIAQTLARMEICVSRLDADGFPQPNKRHPVWKLLNVRPNDYQTAFQFKETLFQNVLLYGNGFARIERDRAGRPIRMHLMRPDLTYLYRDPVTQEAVYQFMNAGVEAQRMVGYDVIHIAGPSSDGMLGEPLIYLCREVIAIEIDANEYVSSFFRNSGRPGGYIEHPTTLSDESYKRLKESWQDVYGGSSNAWKTALLEGGAKFVKMAVDPEEAQLIEIRRFCREQICSVFSVPPLLVGGSDKPDGARTGENATTLFTQQGLSPWAARAEQEFNQKLFVETSEYASSFNFEQLSRADTKTRYDSYRTALSAGFLKVNEVRAYEGLPPVEGGDVVRVPLNMADIESAATMNQGTQVEGDKQQDKNKAQSTEPSQIGEKGVTDADD